METHYSGNRVARPELCVVAKYSHFGVPQGTKGYIQAVHGSMTDRAKRTVIVRWYTPLCAIEKLTNDTFIPANCTQYTAHEAERYIEVVQTRYVRGIVGAFKHMVEREYRYHLVVR